MAFDEEELRAGSAEAASGAILEQISTGLMHPVTKQEPRCGVFSTAPVRRRYSPRPIMNAFLFISRN